MPDHVQQTGSMPRHFVGMLHGVLCGAVLKTTDNWRDVMRLQAWILLVPCLTCIGCSEPQSLRFLDQLADGGVGSCSDAGNVGDVCSVGQGACERAGTYVCTDGRVTCSA